MATFLTRQIFSGGGRQGWTEDYFQDAPTVFSAKAFAIQWAAKRLKILAAGYHLDLITVSNVAVLRDSKEAEYDGPAGDGDFPAEAGIRGGFGEQVYDRLLVRIEAGPQRRRPYELGGIPEQVIDQNGRYDPVPLFRSRLNAWVDFAVPVQDATGGPLRIRVQAGGPLLLVQSVVQVPTETLSIRFVVKTVDLVGIGGLNPSNVIRASRFRNTANVDGLWRVYSTTTDAPVAGMTTIITENRRYPPLYTPVSIPGILRKLAPITEYAAVDAMFPQRGVSRKTGGPFVRQRGRQTRLRR